MAIFKTSGDISASELQTFFSQSGDFQITDYYRGGGIVPATRDAAPTYPTTGGLALDDIGSIALPDADAFYSWPTGGTLQGQTANFTYNPGDGTTDSENPAQGGRIIDGSITNNTGAPIAMSGVNITCRITYTAFNADAGGNINPFFWVIANQNVGFPQPTVSQLNTQIVYTIAGGQGAWTAGGTLRFRMFSNTPNDRPFNYTVDNLRINLNSSTTEFVPTGGGTTDINTTFPESGDITFTDFYGVDNGADDTAQQRENPDGILLPGSGDSGSTPPPDPTND